MASTAVGTGPAATVYTKAAPLRVFMLLDPEYKNERPGLDLNALKEMFGENVLFDGGYALLTKQSVGADSKEGGGTSVVPATSDLAPIDVLIWGGLTGPLLEAVSPLLQHIVIPFAGLSAASQALCRNHLQKRNAPHPACGVA
jgi:hypothetical protein